MHAQALIERGEKLSEIEDRTAVMADHAKDYGNNASQLLDKFKNKKWYQL
jgi:syntaxin-binding protein 5